MFGNNNFSSKSGQQSLGVGNPSHHDVLLVPIIQFLIRAEIVGYLLNSVIKVYLFHRFGMFL